MAMAFGIMGTPTTVGPHPFISCSSGRDVLSFRCCDVSRRQTGIPVQAWTKGLITSGELLSTPRRGYAAGKQQQGRTMVVAGLPTAVTAAVALFVVGAAVTTLARENKKKIASLQVKKECEECNGSGLCPACNGEGFLNKNLSPEAAAKARAKALDAATRYTSGLAKKWKYCSTCSGGRGCPACQGRGWLDD